MLFLYAYFLLTSLLLQWLKNINWLLIAITTQSILFLSILVKLNIFLCYCKDLNLRAVDKRHALSACGRWLTRRQSQLPGILLAEKIITKHQSFIKNYLTDSQIEDTGDSNKTFKCMREFFKISDSLTLGALF